MLLTPAGVITAVMLVTTFGHGWDTNVKLENTSETGSEKLFCAKAEDNTLGHLLKIVEQLSITFGGGLFISLFIVQKKKKMPKCIPG